MSLAVCFMSKFRVILAAAFALLLSAASFAGPLDPDDPDGGGEIPGGGGPGSGGEVTPLIDPVAIIVPLAQQLAPLAAVAASLALLVYAVKQGAGMLLVHLGLKPPPPRGMVPKSTGDADLDLAQAAGYVEARKRDARRKGARAYRDERSANRDRSGSGSRSRSRSSSSRNGRRRR